MSEYETFLDLYFKWEEARDRIFNGAITYFKEVKASNPNTCPTKAGLIDQLLSAFDLLDRDITPKIEEFYSFEHVPGDILITLNNKMLNRINTVIDLAETIENEVLLL